MQTILRVFSQEAFFFFFFFNTTGVLFIPYKICDFFFPEFSFIIIRFLLYILLIIVIVYDLNFNVITIISFPGLSCLQFVLSFRLTPSFFVFFCIVPSPHLSSLFSSHLLFLFFVLFLLSLFPPTTNYILQASLPTIYLYIYS